MKINTKSRFMSRRGFLAKTTAALAALSMSNRLFAQSNDGTWNAEMELGIDFEIIAVDARRYKKPYVAVWIEDASGNAVRTIALWVMPGKGEKWVPDLKRWYRDERSRSQTDGGDLVATVASPTRSPGQYSVVWDGLNDSQVLVPQGEYFVCIETAREHGPYHLVREKLSFGEESFTQVLTGDTELGDVTVEYRQRS